MTTQKSLIHTFKYLSNVYIYMLSKENTKITENISINEPKNNEKNITKYNKLYFLLQTPSLID